MEQQARRMEKARETALAHDETISDNLKRFASRRTDIFGGSEVKDDENQPAIIWDGVNADPEVKQVLTMQAARAQIAREKRERENAKPKPNIGPSTNHVQCASLRVAHRSLLLLSWLLCVVARIVVIHFSLFAKTQVSPHAPVQVPVLALEPLPLPPLPPALLPQRPRPRRRRLRRLARHRPPCRWVFPGLDPQADWGRVPWACAR